MTIIEAIVESRNKQSKINLTPEQVPGFGVPIWESMNLLDMAIEAMNNMIKEEEAKETEPIVPFPVEVESEGAAE